MRVALSELGCFDLLDIQNQDGFVLLDMPSTGEAFEEAP